MIFDRNNPSALTYRFLSFWIGHLDRCMASFCDRGYLRQFASQCEAALAVARFDRCIGEVTDGAPCYADLLYYYGIPTRLEICRDRRPCKIFVSCVNFSKKQHGFLLICQVYTHQNANFIHNC